MADNIHPTNKQTVGKRLALAALGIAYNEKLVYSGPVYDSMEIRENEIVLKFKHTGSGLVAVGGELSQFAVAGGNRKFVWANARIAKDTVVVQSDEVMAPIAVRYAWGNNPDGCNLYNKEGLPAVPFQTDK
ncbi:sialate O-acetylesterase, partial [PVC group bacterium]|nr:sialate O-acetylesterase [PVC group bacterium]